MIRFGVAGLSFGQFHVKTLVNLEGALLTAVADPRKEISDSIAQQYNVEPFYDGIEMIESGKIDAVNICVPPSHRQALLEAAVKKGIAVFLEKPLAANTEQARLLKKISEKSQKPVMTGFSFRFHPAVVKLKELIDTELGAVLAAHGSYVFDFLPPAERWLWDTQNGGGLFNENSCHLFDLVMDLMGEPVKVKASGGSWFGRPSEEASAVSLEFREGNIASLMVGGIGSGGNHQFPTLDLYCVNGSARLIGRDHSWHEIEWSIRGESNMQRMTMDPEQLGRSRYSDSLELFIEAINGEIPVASDVDDGIRSVILAESVYDSIRNDKSVLWEDFNETGN